MILGYARVSTSDQNLDAQLDALRQAGASGTFADKISGSLRKRPELERLFDQLDASKNQCMTRARMIHWVRIGDGVDHGAGTRTV